MRHYFEYFVGFGEECGNILESVDCGGVLDDVDGLHLNELIRVHCILPQRMIKIIMMATNVIISCTAIHDL